MSILKQQSHHPLGTTISMATPDEIVEILQACVENLSGNYDVDITDLEYAIENLEFARDYDVNVSITFDLSVRVSAKSEEDVDRILNDEITATELVNGDWNEYVHAIDVQNINQEITEIEEA